MLSYSIDETNHCRSVESFIRNLLPRAPRSYLYKLLNSGHITVNGAEVDPATLLCIGDVATLKESSRTKSLIATRPPRLDIIFEDQWLIACNKPAGLPMHRTAEPLTDNLVDLGEQFLADRDGAPCKIRPVNRLDSGTSGVVLLAKSSTAAGMLGRLVKEEGLDKLYLAMVSGIIPKTGRIEAPLAGKPSITDFKLLYAGNGFSFVAIQPRTGRMHQIRQHFAMEGHPVLGDRRYGSGKLDDAIGHLLHSFRTMLNHPANGQRLTLSAPLPFTMLRYLNKMAGLELPALMTKLAEP